MEFNLEQFASTLCVGAFVLACAGVAVWAFGGALHRLAGSLQGAAGAKPSDSLVWTVAGIACFGLGMIVENLSHRFMDDDNPVTSVFLTPEKELRARVLFGDTIAACSAVEQERHQLGSHAKDHPGFSLPRWLHQLRNDLAAASYGCRDATKVAPLGVEAAELELLDAYAFELTRSPKPTYVTDRRATEVQQKVRELAQRGTVLDESALRLDWSGTGGRLYYLAKNTLYRQDKYYDELARIQTRVDFSRSIALISILFAIACGVAMTLLAVRSSVRLHHRTALSRAARVAFRLFPSRAGWSALAAATTTSLLGAGVSSLFGPADAHGHEASFAAAFIFLGLVATVATVLTLVRAGVDSRPAAPGEAPGVSDGTPDQGYPPRASWARRPAILVIVLTSAWWLGRYSHQNEESEFNKRVYGYFLSSYRYAKGPAEPPDALSALSGVASDSAKK